MLLVTEVYRVFLIFLDKQLLVKPQFKRPRQGFDFQQDKAPPHFHHDGKQSCPCA
jgi:hypothetical protein